MKFKREFVRFAGELKMRLVAKLKFTGSFTYSSQPKAKTEAPPAAGQSADRSRRESPFGKHGSN